MPQLIVMDGTGDSRMDFSGGKSSASTKKAMERFNELMGQGYIAVKSDGSGNKQLTRKFDAGGDIILHRQLIGG